jgi:hypothetical protein
MKHKVINCNLKHLIASYHIDLRQSTKSTIAIASYQLSHITLKHKINNCNHKHLIASYHIDLQQSTKSTTALASYQLSHITLTCGKAQSQRLQSQAFDCIITLICVEAQIQQL